MHCKIQASENNGGIGEDPSRILKESADITGCMWTHEYAQHMNYYYMGGINQ